MRVGKLHLVHNSQLKFSARTFFMRKSVVLSYIRHAVLRHYSESLSQKCSPTSLREDHCRSYKLFCLCALYAAAAAFSRPGAPLPPWKLPFESTREGVTTAAWKAAEDIKKRRHFALSRLYFIPRGPPCCHRGTDERFREFSHVLANGSVGYSACVRGRSTDVRHNRVEMPIRSFALFR